MCFTLLVPLAPLLVATGFATMVCDPSVLCVTRHLQTMPMGSLCRVLQLGSHNCIPCLSSPVIHPLKLLLQCTQIKLRLNYYKRDGFNKLPCCFALIACCFHCMQCLSQYNASHFVANLPICSFVFTASVV